MRNITSRRQARLPKHCHHKPSGRGYVRIPGFKMVYTGKWDTHEADAEYMRLIQEWLAADRQVPARWESAGDYDITDLLSEFMVWADGHYRREDGTTSREVDNLRLALRPLRLQFGTLPVGNFSPKKLKAYRQVMVEEGRLTRETINQRVGIVKRLFAWAVSEEKCSPEVGYGLRTITHLRPGRYGLRGQRKVQPVSREHVEAVLHYLVPTHAAMLALQSWTGMRPGEVVQMRAEDIDMEDPDVWVYRPARHKTERFGYEREIALGPKCVFRLRPFLQRHSSGHLFRPGDALTEAREQAAKCRKTPQTPSQRKRAQQAARRGQEGFHDHIQVTNFSQAVRRACDRAGIPPFTPNQVRHLVATEVSREHGLPVAQAVLGHKSVSTTQVYAKVADDRRRQVAREMG